MSGYKPTKRWGYAIGRWNANSWASVLDPGSRLLSLLWEPLLSSTSGVLAQNMASENEEIRISMVNMMIDQTYCNKSKSQI